MRASLPRLFLAGLAQIWRSNRFAGSELWRKLLQAAVSFTRLLGTGRLGSPKWNKQTSLVNTCRRIVSQICLFFYLGVYNLYFTKLKSRVTLYRNARGKRTLVEREVGFIWSLNIMSSSRNSPSQKERLLTRFQIPLRTGPVTRTLKGNETSSSYSWSYCFGSSYRGRLQNSICHVKIDIVTDFSALQGIVQYKSNLFHQKR